MGVAAGLSKAIVEEHIHNGRFLASLSAVLGEASKTADRLATTLDCVT